MILRSRPGTAGGRDGGVSLIELLVAVALLGTATVTILGAFGTLIKTSDLGRRTADMGSALAAAADAVADDARNPYDHTCAAVLPYNPKSNVQLPAGMTAALDPNVKYWDGAGGSDGHGAFGPVCHDDVPTWRLQLITVTMRTADGKVTRSISVVKRG